MGETINKILVVDDSAASLTMINGILKQHYKVYPVNSGEVALAFLTRQRPDLILLDMEMPEMSGLDLLHILKTDPNLSDIPVILLTGNADIESEANAFTQGAADYIYKPVNNIILLARIKFHLELAAYRKRL